MNSALRKVLLAVAVAVFVAFIWHRLSTPEAPQEALLRQVQWKLGPVGKLWNKGRSQLPLRWQMDVPASSAPDWLGATDWLSQHANDPEVARSIVRTWPRWNPEAQALWLFWIQDRRQELSTDYLPLIRTELTQNPKIVYPLLPTLARNRPLSVDAVALFVHFFEVQFPVLNPTEQGHLLSELAVLDSLPREVLIALAASTENAVPEVALTARVVLAQLAPAEFRLDANAESQFRQLSQGDQLQLLWRLRAPEFQRGETPAWALSRVADLVRLHHSAGTTNVQGLKPLFTFLEEVGPSGSALAPAVASRFVAGNSEVRSRAARALTQLSPPTPELLAALLPHLEFDSATITILTWLAANPAQSQAAEPVIVLLCEGHSPRQTASAPPNGSGKLDPTQARRGSLGMGRPEGLQLDCRPKSIPAALLPGWPGYRSLYDELAVSVPQTNSNRFLKVLLSRLPEVTFRELAEHCLAEIRAARNTPTNHPALSKGSDH